MKETYNLKEEIKSLGMGQKEFAEMLDMHTNTISQWVRGINEIPQWVKVLIFHYRRSQLFDELKDKFNEVEPKGVCLSPPPIKSHSK